MDTGRIVEKGRHEDLLAARGLYCQLHRTQLGIYDDMPAPATGAREEKSDPGVLVGE